MLHICSGQDQERVGVLVHILQGEMQTFFGGGGCMNLTGGFKFSRGVSPCVQIFKMCRFFLGGGRF